MRARILALLMLVTPFFFSCQKDQDVKPATNPRFSVALIQEIDGDGVLFAANVFDFGSDEIIEHGFVYSQTSVPRVENDDVVSQKGKPNEFFELKGVHSMKLGQTYRVAAFMKTSKAIIYSEVIAFVSQGSLGFLFSEIVSPSNVFFEDTLVVKGSNFSKIMSNYRVTIQGVSGRVLEVSESGFSFTLPSLFLFGEKQVNEGLFDIEITVAGKVLKLAYRLNFRQPSFEIDPNQIINYEDTVKINGSYFNSESIQVKYLGENGGDINLPVVGFSETQIKFMPVANFFKSNPNIRVIIRGQEHIVSDLFKLKAPEVSPGQLLSNSINRNFNIKVKNLNIHNVEWNSLSFGSLNFGNNISSATSEGLNFGIFSEYEDFIPRSFEVFVTSGGQKSINSAKVNLTNPYLPFMRASGVFREDVGVGSGVSMGDYGYFFRVNSIYKFTPGTRNIELVARNQYSAALLANIFTLKSPNGKIYSGGHEDNVFLPQSSPEMFEFDPSNNTLVKLPKIPTDVIRPQSVYATDKYLYYEGGYIIDSNEGTIEVQDRWRFDFSSKIWEKLSTQTESNDSSYRFKTFWYNGKLFKIGIDQDSGGSNVLKEFDPILETWNTKTKLLDSSRIYTEVIPIIGNEAFLCSFNKIIKLNLDTFQESIVQNIDDQELGMGFSPNQIMPINGKLYSTYSSYSIVELDPAYFTY